MAVCADRGQRARIAYPGCRQGMSPGDEHVSISCDACRYDAVPYEAVTARDPATHRHAYDTDCNTGSQGAVNEATKAEEAELLGARGSQQRNQSSPGAIQSLSLCQKMQIAPPRSSTPRRHDLLMLIRTRALPLPACVLRPPVSNGLPRSAGWPAPLLARRPSIQGRRTHHRRACPTLAETCTKRTSCVYGVCACNCDERDDGACVRACKRWHASAHAAHHTACHQSTTNCSCIHSTQDPN